MTNLRHIIVEGPDGAGKDTLIVQLMGRFKGTYELHRRASTSTGGPISDLATWVSLDVNTITDQPNSIYNRHPLISEPIYRKYRTNGKITPREFDNKVWYDTMCRWAAKHSVVVLCLPEFAAVKSVLQHQGPSMHMPGVYENIFKIYMDYTELPNRWPGTVIPYSYLTDTPENLAASITKHFDEKGR